MTATHVSSGTARIAREVGDRLERNARAYAGGESRPLRGYVAAMGAYGALVAGGAALVRWRRKPLPSLTAGDIVLLGAATNKLSRRITKDAVTSPVRAPFTRFEAPAGNAEVHEEVRDEGGVRHAFGELVTCPFCMAQWVATALAFSWALAPRATRFVAATMTAVAVSDGLNFAQAAADKVVRGGDGDDEGDGDGDGDVPSRNDNGAGQTNPDHAEGAAR